MIGTLLKDTYRVVQPLGEGGMGTLYIAEHKTLPRRYAVKVLKTVEAPSAELLARFEREARIASGLGHPNIVEVIDFDRQPDGSPYIVMELLDGEDLASRLAKTGAMNSATLLPLCRQLCAALAVAHDADIVHRDLKPRNVFLHRWGDQELVKVLDFGISKMAGGQTELTADSAVIGTAHYMAPEQARGAAAEVDGRADLFSLGTIVFECLTGKRAFDGESLPEIIHALCYGERPLLATHTPELAEALEPVLARLLAVEREDRYSTVQEAWNELAPALGGEATTLPLGKPAPESGLGLEATVAATPDPAMDATVASDPAMDATVASDPASPSDSAAEPPSAAHAASPTGRSIRRRTKVVLTALVVALFGVPLLLWGALALRSHFAAQGGSSSNKKTPTTKVTPETRPRLSKRVTLALLPGKCQGKATDIAESLRESRLTDYPGLLLPPDDIDRAQKIIAKEGGSVAGMERRVGQHLGATLLMSTRCVAKQVKVRLVQVSDGVVLATQLVDQPMSAHQLRDLISQIRFERLKLVAEIETSVAVATKAFQEFIKAQQGGVHRGNLDRIIQSLNKARQADPNWDRPRFHLAYYLSNQYKLTRKPALIARITRLLTPLARPGSEFEGWATHMQGTLALYQENLSLALTRLDRAVTLLPNEPRVHRARSSVYLLMGEDRLAQEALSKARAADPGNTFTDFETARLHWVTGDFAAALKAIAPRIVAQDRQQRLGATDPDLRLGNHRREGAHSLRGLILLYLGRPKEASKEFRTELGQLASQTSLTNKLMEAFTYFGLAMLGRLEGDARRTQRARKRADRALKKFFQSSGNPNPLIRTVMWGVAPLAADWIGPLIDRWGRPKLSFYADLQVCRAGALARLGKRKDAQMLLTAALAAAKPDRRKGLRAIYRRFLKMCRKVDRHRGINRRGKKGRRRPPKPR